MFVSAQNHGALVVASVRLFLFYYRPFAARVSLYRLSSSSSKVIGVGVLFPILIRERFYAGSFFSRNARENTNTFASVSSTKLALYSVVVALVYNMR